MMYYILIIILYLRCKVTKSQSNISLEIKPSATFVTGPVIVTEKSFETIISISPPGICTVMFESHKPNRYAVAAAALLLLPDANV